MQVFFINKVKRSEIKGKKIFEVGEKYYFEDLGIRNAIIGYNPEHIHKIIEKMVVSMDELFENTNIDGIEHIHFMDFLSREW